MINFNKGDKFLKSIMEGLNDLPHIKDIPNAKDLHIYGLSTDRGYQIAIPHEFIHSRRLVDKFEGHVGITSRIACHWGSAREFGYNCLGLGFDVRENNPEVCKKIILTTYLWLNDKVDHGQRRRNGGPTGAPMRREEREANEFTLPAPIRAAVTRLQ